MKETIFDYKDIVNRENITYHFQPSQYQDAIRLAIMKRCKEKLPNRNGHLQQHHVGGLPSPPVEERKVASIFPEEENEVYIKQEPIFSPPPASPTPSLSIQEIKEKIEALEQEKHRLFQMIKQLMLQEEQEKKRRIEESAKNEKKRTKKKSRWAPVSQESPFYNNAFYSRPRYNYVSQDIFVALN
ncbi:uncharacterized protein B0P05DRAFT_556361 [Gilbertella persicaria]|uniref:uncharacterized protein n=1 Tax=Gilbertella persicaria TaxID=101096 RepID=UPI00221FF504|nr:uncharacterized protein B0P05DRAFT_556361 [Gilbertella persicaria]KAI8062848.1 hypothetical protein B0P05DRAFT_556361 [Gilbertella persicaria]